MGLTMAGEPTFGVSSFESDDFTRTRERLHSDDFSALIYGRIGALRVKDFCSTAIRKRLLDEISTQSSEPYTYWPGTGAGDQQVYLGVRRVGEPFNASYSGSAAARDRYYVEAERQAHELSAPFSTDAHPMVRLRQEIGTLWPGGVRPAAFEGREMSQQLVRIVTAEESHLGSQQPHFDCLPQRYAPLEAQFAACIYLEMPSAQGALELWPVPRYSHAQIGAIDPSCDLRAMWPDPHSIVPTEGDLILFDTRRPHCVAGFTSGRRVSLHCFIGLTGEGGLVTWI